jgi:hypothetical protein
MYNSEMENVMQTWEQMSRRDQLAATHYDYYKDVHGIRPRWMNYDAMTEQELEQELEQLGREAEVQAKEDAERQKIAIAKFEDRVANLMHSGTNRERVIAWLMDAEDANGDIEYFCYTQGLPYGYFRKTA